jgi:septal ring factor EnvC (AmiA/AmiB activator)
MCVIVLSYHVLFSQHLKKSETWKPQLELCKKQIAELHQRLSEERSRGDKFEFECKNMQEKLSALHREKEVGRCKVMQE